MSAERPTAGARYVLTRALDDAREGANAALYRGFVHLPDADLPAEVTVELPGGATRAAIVGGTPELEKMAAALVRAATKAELARGIALPRKIVRWRG